VIKFAAPHAQFIDSELVPIREKHYKPGSTVELRCVVSDYLTAFGPVVWRHGQEIVEDGGREGVR